jgi:DNA adenine methylase
VRSIIRWAGSKRQIVDRLAAHWPSDAKRYVEPFAGSASLFFAIDPPSALLSDLNQELVGTYQALRHDVGRVLECFRRLPVGETAYYRIRADPRADASDAERAARFLYLNRFCFNGLYRTNASGGFNVPYGPPRRPLLNFEREVASAADRLRQATVKAQDFALTLADTVAGDFVYIDPPYAVDDRRIFREYLPGSFSREDLGRLATGLSAMNRRGVTFLLSYAESKEGRELGRGWYQKIIVTRRHVAGFASDRRSAREYLISNRPIEKKTP